MSDLDIRVLGRFSVAVDGKLIEEQRWLRKKARLLVKLLAVAPGKKMHREQLLEIPWPDAEADLGLNNLHKVIHVARRAFEPELSQGAASRFLLTQDSQVVLARAAVRIDADEFEALATNALKAASIPDLEAALRLYGGDLLEEDLYEEWAANVARGRRTAGEDNIRVSIADCSVGNAGRRDGQGLRMAEQCGGRAECRPGVFGHRSKVRPSPFRFPLSPALRSRRCQAGITISAEYRAC
jgi:hypothetical protein